LHILGGKGWVRDDRKYQLSDEINGSISNAFTNTLKQTYKLVCVCSPGKTNEDDIIQNHCPCGVFFFWYPREKQLIVMFFEKFF